MSELKQKKQYDLINAMRIISAFFVVLIHVQFPGATGKAVVCIARFAVPFFFMVSGFFSYYKDESVYLAKVKGKIKHTVVLTALSIALYFAFNAAINLLAGTLPQYLKGKITLVSAFELFVFNHVGVAEFLWFLSALLYVYIVFYFLCKFRIQNKVAFLIPILILGGILGRESIEIFDNLHWIFGKSYLYRNFLSTGLPFFLMGYFIRKNEEKITSKLSVPVLAVMLILGAGEALAVELLHTQKSIYIGTAVAVFALFVLVVKLEDKVNVPTLASLGAKYSLYVYIFHIIVRDVLKIAINRIGLNMPIVSWVLPFVVFGVTLVASIVYLKIKTTVLIKKG